MKINISGSLVLSFFLSGCATVTYTPNNSIAISDQEANDFVKKASQTKTLEEYVNVLGYSKHDGYYTFVDKEPYGKFTISWRTFSAFCRAQGGTTQDNPKFSQLKTSCPLPTFVEPTSKTYTTATTYCKIPRSDDATKMSADTILYVFYSRFKGEYPQGGDGVYVTVTGDQNIIAPIKVCYNKAYEDSLVYLEQDRLKKEAAQKKKEEQEKLKALEREKQATLAQQGAEEAKKLHEKRVKEINDYRNGKFLEEMVTNCGPILEVKKTMVKVYFPVQGYGNEHWIPKTELFPQNYGCQFVNGQYYGASMKY